MNQADGVLKRPYKKLNPQRLLFFLWVILSILFASGFLLALHAGQFYSQLSSDFMGFYATAQIVRSAGFSQIYNLPLQEQFQRAVFHQFYPGLPETAFVTTPVPYLPFFIVMFLPLAALDYPTAFWVWDLVNLGLMLVFLFYFSRALGKTNGRDLLIPLLVCVPVFSNFFLGQVNVILMIFLAEFLFFSLKGKSYLSGLWLSGLLLKPQTLILIIPGLLIQKRYKTLAGFALGGVGIMMISLLLVGPQSLVRLGFLLMGYVHGLPSNSPEAMMNWRALGIHLSKVLPEWVAALITVEGMVLTVIVVLSLWKLPIGTASPRFGLLLLGTFAGTLTVTWHAHNFMQQMLIPLILFLYARELLPWKIIYIWTFLPPVLFGVMLLLTQAYAYYLYGMGSLAVNLILLGWTASVLKGWKRLNADSTINLRPL